MEKKSLELYTEEEKEALLIHWWQNYGRVNATLTEVEEFLELVKQDSRLVFDIALASSLLGKTTEPLVYAMRTNTLSDFIESVSAAVASDKYQNMREQLECNLLDELVPSYNHRNSGDLSDEKDKLFQLLDIPVSKKHIPLTVKEVVDVYKTCVLTGEELIFDEFPPVDFVIGHAIDPRCNSLFAVPRLEKERKRITELVDQVIGVDEETFISQMMLDRKGKRWTTDMDVVCLLVELGNALGILNVMYCEDENSNPCLYVNRNSEKDAAKFFGKRLDECKSDI